MSFEIIHEVKKQHPCNPPNPQEFVNEHQLTVGTRIRCEGCGATFKLSDSQMDGLYWMREAVIKPPNPGR